ncbi:MAG TPA: DNA polymerase I [Halothiobacillus sp.]|nr:DNA polymerase I [Halothiobacillus sp.]
MSKPTVILVDGSSFLFRAFHALPPLTTSKGMPTGAIHGMVNMLRKLIKDYKPTHMAVVFDAPGKTFRNAIFPEYKAHRPPLPEDLRVQIKPVHDFVKAMGLPLLCEDGVEADDVIGTLAMEAKKQGARVLIATADKDFAQLVNEDITLINTMSGTITDVAAVKRKFGVPPERMIDYLALIGDTVDNVPGVPGCGPKTAAKWLSQFGDLDTLMAHADEIKGKIGEKLRASLGHLPMARNLVTIRTDVALPAHSHIDHLNIGDPDYEALLALATEFELNTWRRQLEAAAKNAANGQSASVKTVAIAEQNGLFSAGKTSATYQGHYELITEQAQLDDWLARLAKAELFAFDTETTTLDYMDAQIVGVSFAIEAGKAAYVPLAHDYEGAPAQLDRDWVLAALKPLLESEAHHKLLHNAKFDAHVLNNHGIKLAGVIHDSMLESYVLDSVATQHDMDSMAAHYLSLATTTFEDIAGKGAKQKTFNQIDLAMAAPYAAEDADVTLQLHQTLWPKLKSQPKLCRVYREIEMPLIPVLRQMEQTGVRIDTDMLARQGEAIEKDLARIEQQAYELAGRAFNLSSPKQLQALLFDELGLPVTQKTSKGQPSTNEEALSELAEQHPLPKLILEHRALAKLKSTYIDKLPELIHPRTGRIHTSYHQAVTATGRLSSSNPNLQNIPVRSEEGRRIRKAFVASPGYVILSADYSQIELRIMAHLSGDESLLKAFAEGRDIHRATAAEVFALAEDQVSADQRRAAKAINFGLIYGMSAFGLAKQLGVDRSEAQAYVDLYFQRYPGVKDYMERTRAQARDRGYVETVFGRRLYLPEIRSRHAQRRQYAERTAINAPMQGTAADIIKRAMIAIHGWLDGHDSARMIMQVHDELVFEVREDQLDGWRDRIIESMTAAAELKVPLEVEVGMGPDWDAAH